jgi:hypothetical protein
MGWRATGELCRSHDKNISRLFHRGLRAKQPPFPRFQRGRPAHDHNIAIVDHGVNHRIPLHFQGKQVIRLFLWREQAAGDINACFLVIIVEI